MLFGYAIWRKRQAVCPPRSLARPLGILFGDREKAGCLAKRGPFPGKSARLAPLQGLLGFALRQPPGAKLRAILMAASF